MIEIIMLLAIFVNTSNNSTLATDESINIEHVAKQKRVEQIDNIALPQQKGVLNGKLSNGMRYTIMHNAKPEKRAELRLLVKVGSLEEDEDQRGVAHMVEHMAFNGTKHFKKNQLISYLESTGVKFGTHLNASTSYEKTIYKLTVPIKGDLLDKSLTILQDWASGLNFNPKEFDKERGVVLEEARLGDNVGKKLFEQFKYLFFANSRYLNRAPIGLKHIIKNIKVDRAKEFYDKWYRPELMHIVAVGDFNASQLEQTIKEKFSMLTNTNHSETNPRIIPDENSTRVLTITDKEVTNNTLRVYLIDSLTSIKTTKDKKRALIESITMALFNAKAKEQLVKKDPKAMLISLSVGPISKHKAAFIFTTNYKEHDSIAALSELYKLISSYYQYGFSKESLSIIKKKMLANNENIHKKIKDLKSSTIASRLLSIAQNGSVYTDYDYDYNLTKKLIEDIDIHDINEVYREIVDLPNRAILFINTNKEKINRYSVMRTITNSQFTAKDLSIEKRLPTKLMDRDLTAKKIISKEHNTTTDIYRYKLDNGIIVDFKPSKYSLNSVQMLGYSEGGYSLIDNSKLYNAKKASSWISKSGVGKFSNLEVNKILASKKISVTSSIARFGENISTSCASTDMADMFELLYLKITQVKLDKIVFENERKILQSYAKKLNRKPKHRFGVELSKFFYKNNPRVIFDSATNIEKLNADVMLDIYRDRFADMNNFYFVIVGDTNTSQVEEMISTYLANMPTMDRNETFVKREYSYLKGKQQFSRKYNNNNIANITLTYKSEYRYNPKNKATLDAMVSILNIRLRNLIREDKSAVYGISVSDSVVRELKNKTTIQVSFACNPKRVNEIITAVKTAIENFKRDGVSRDELSVFTKKFNLDYQIALKNNNFWLSGMMSSYKYHIPIDILANLDKMVSGIEIEDINNTANKVFGEDELLTKLLPKDKK